MKSQSHGRRIHPKKSTQIRKFIWTGFFLGNFVRTPEKIRVTQGPLNGGVSNGGFPDLDLSFLFCPFLSFLGLSRFFWDFPDLLGDGPGIFPISPFPLTRPIKSTYEEQSRKGPGQAIVAHTLVVLQQGEDVAFA